MCVCKIFRTYLFIYLLIFNKLIECILFGTRCQNWQYLVQQMFLFLAKSPHLVTKEEAVQIRILREKIGLLKA